MMPRTRSRGAHAAAHRSPRPAPVAPGPPRRPESRPGGTGDRVRTTGGSKVSRLPRAMVAKVTVVAVIVGVIGFGLVKGGEASAEPTVQAFLLAWENGHYKTAAAMTTGQPAVVTDALSG